MEISNHYWLIAALVCGFTAFLHLIAGHYEPIKPFMASDTPAMRKGTLYACWHMVTVVLFGSAIALLSAALGQGSALLVLFISVLFLLFGLLFLLIAIGFSPKRNPFFLPQWTLLLPIGGLGLLGLQQ
ncbi:hypothetical protein [Thaumasiovibrio subtropicus]|uniref:hypothetical protein n=1 Tax=Thaumasiovibrio subtropicus TaxID=1891207 RepID=UPI000B35D413|nr:hypothetical protein [Thaumasiovibrio subtropicus]